MQEVTEESIRQGLAAGTINVEMLLHSTETSLTGVFLTSDIFGANYQELFLPGQAQGSRG